MHSQLFNSVKILSSCILFLFSINELSAETKGDTVLVNKYVKQAKTFLPNQPDSVMYWYEKAKKESRNQRWTRDFIVFNKEIVDMFEGRSENVKAVPVMEDIIANYSFHKNSKLQYAAFSSLAMTHAYVAELDEALGYFSQARLLLDSCLLKDRIAYCEPNIRYYTNIGISHAIVGQNNTALEYFLTADSLQQDCPTDARANIKFCLATIYSELMDNEKALSYFKILESWVESGEVEYSMIPAYDNMAIIYIQASQFDSARHYLAKGLKASRAIGDSTSVAYNFMYMGSIYGEEKDFVKAEEYFKKSASLFLSAGYEKVYQDVQVKRIEFALDAGEDIPQMEEIIQDMSRFYKEAGLVKDLAMVHKNNALWKYRSGKHQEAFLEFQLYDSLIQDYQASEHQEVLAELKTRHETDLLKRAADEQKAIAALANLENKSKSTLIGILAIAAIILLIGLISVSILYRRLKQSRKIVAEQKEGIEKKEKEKSVLLKELHHRVKNNLQIVSSLLNLQKENAKDEAAKGAFKEGQNRVEAMALIHRYLYATDELTKLDLSEYLRQLVQSIAFSYGYHKNEVKLEFDVTEMPVDVDLAIPLGLIANELVSNAFKHAFKEVHIPELRVTLSQQEGLILAVSDNGPGISDEDRNKAGESFGMDLVHTLCSQLKASIHYRYENGAVMQLEIAESIYNKETTTYENSVA